MTNTIRRLAAACVLLLLCAAAFAGKDDDRIMVGLKGRAEAFVHAMVTGNGHVVQGDLDPKMRKTMNPETMKVMMGDLLTRGGGLRTVEPATMSVQGDGRVVAMVPMHMKRNSVCAQVVFDRFAPLCKIVGFSILPWDESMRPKPAGDAAAAAEAVPAPAYATPGTFREIEVELPFANGPLKGILAIPVTAGETVPVPGAVLLPGMGAFDPDMAVGRSRPFRDIAQGLAARGVAVLRFETIENARPGTPDEAGWRDAEDWRLEHARDAVAWMVARTDVQDDNVTVVGHNLGAYIAPVVVRETKAVRAALLAPPPVPVSAWLRSQTQRILAADPDMPEEGRRRFEDVLSAVDRLQKGELTDSELVLDCPGAVWKELERLDPVAELAAMDKPTRVFFAEKDFMVPEAEAGRWKSLAQENGQSVKLDVVAGANHLFVPVEGETATAGNVLSAGNVDADLVEQLAAFARTGKMPVL